MKGINLEKGEWYASIAPNLGGNIVCLTYRGKDVLCPFRHGEQAQQSSYLIGSPMLLPANRTYEGRFFFEGKEYQLPLNEPANNAHLHGLVNGSAFCVEQYDEKQVVLSLENRKEIYPFPFLLKVIYRLEKEGLYCSYHIKNTGDCGMPLTFGLHTTFTEPDFCKVPVGAIQEKDAHHIPTGQYLPLDQQTAELAEGICPKGKSYSCYLLSAGHVAYIGSNLRYEVSEQFDHWILFNGGGNTGFLCVEPQCGAVNGLNKSGGHCVIAAGESLLLTANILIKDWRE